MRLETCISKGLHLKAYRVREIREEEGRLVAVLELIAGRLLKCGTCSLTSSRVHSRQREREWKDLRIRDQELVLRYAPLRVRCRRCGPRVEKLPWADPWQRITRSLLSAVATLSRKLSWKETAERFALNWKTVSSAVKKAVAWGREEREWLEYVGVRD